MKRALGTADGVALSSALRAARAEIAQLQRTLASKMLEAEQLKEALDVARAKKWITRVPLLPLDDH